MIRQAWVEIDLGKIKQNVINIKQSLSEKTLFMAVVKANGYGHGSVEIAKTALANGAQRLGVALVEEAIPLREAGISCPINLLSGPPPGSAKKIDKLGLTATVFSEAHLLELKDIKVDAHIKIDTGMNRIGLRAEELDYFLQTLKKYPNINAEGMFTHFATADEPEGGVFSRQLDLFTDLAKKHRSRFEIISAANSAASLFNKDSHFDMVRIGIAMYGLEPSNERKSPVELKPALTWKAKPSFVKKIKAGESVSYGAKFTAETDISIATIPVGYADGYFRGLSNKAFVLTQGQRLPQIGTVCMDQFSVLTGDLDIDTDKPLILLGEDGKAKFTADDMAILMKTINYEIVCAISSRVPRVCVDTGNG